MPPACCARGQLSPSASHLVTPVAVVKCVARRLRKKDGGRDRKVLVYWSSGIRRRMWTVVVDAVFN